jgi:Zn-dependent peptidase ImmA (M78 family)
MRRLPSKIDLGLELVHVKLVTKKEMREECDLETEEDSTPEGVWDYDQDTIFIGRWLSPKRKREVLFHELVHAMIDYREHGSYETED